MAREPDLPCRRCGKLMWRGRGTLPEGQATCRQCRSEERRTYADLTPEERKAYWRRNWSVKSGNVVVDRTIDCGTCGQTFTTSQPRAKYCSRLCKQRSHDAKARAALRRGASFVGEPFTTEQVAERDRWRCGLCGRRISTAPQWPDADSLSLDHIVPLSEGGAHSLPNVQVAHLGCNISKGARAAEEQLRLV